MPSYCVAFGLNNRKSGMNKHLRFFPFPKNSEMCRVWCHGLMNNTYPKTPGALFVTDLRLFKPNRARDEGISANIRGEDTEKGN